MRIRRMMALAAMGAVLGGSLIVLAQTTEPSAPDPDAAKVTQMTQTPTGEAGKAGATTKEAPQKAPDQSMIYLLIMLGGFFLLYMWMGRGRKKEKKRREEMLAALKKGDKITTIGGVVGTVVEVRPEEVTVKVDESANVRMKFARWAIRGVGEAGKAEDDRTAGGPPETEKK